MVQSANLWKGDDLPELALLCRSWLGRTLLKRKVRAGAIVAPPVVRKDLAEMPLVENDTVVQALSTQRSNELLLCGAVRCAVGCAVTSGSIEVRTDRDVARCTVPPRVESPQS